MSADLTEFGEGALNAKETAAIAALQRVARKWPRSLTLASMGGSLYVMLTEDHMKRHADGTDNDDYAGGMDPEKVVAHLSGIPNTGGDW